MNPDNHVELRNISMVFPGVRALDDVSMSIRRGEVHALLGENGAGKSTMLNILHGVYKPTYGNILIDGKEVAFKDARDAIDFGISKVHQEINMIADMTVAQNIMLGMEAHRGPFLDLKKMDNEVVALLAKVRSNISPNAKVRDLSVGQLQLLQIAKAIQSDAKLISFDEPTASLSNSETEVLFSLMHELREKGITILYVSHRLDEVFKMCDRCTILRDGKFVGSYEVADITKEELIQNMVGRDVGMFAKRMRPSRADRDTKVLEVKNLSRSGVFEDISFDLHKGEILGFYGLVGAGRTEVMRAVFGADPFERGEVRMNGKEIGVKQPVDSIRKGLALLPENRKTEGFIYEFDNSENIALPSLDKFMTAGFMNYRKKRENAERMIDMVNLRPPDPFYKTVSLSGGNQQKVVLAKWLSREADIMIFDEPTKGIDVGAKTEIYNLMESLVEEGKSIIIVSSEQPEVIGMSDRLVVMCGGRIVAEMERDEFDEQKIVAYALEGCES